jgi:hypothetical protein
MDFFGDSRLPERFWSKVRVSQCGCWLWTAYVTPSGYGRYQLRKSVPRIAHRVAFEALIGPVPAGLDLDHLCRVRSCCNPRHLEPVTRSENTRRGLTPEMMRAKHAAVTHCPARHPYDETNTYRPPATRSGVIRHCRACKRDKKRLRRARLRAAAEGAASKPGIVGIAPQSSEVVDQADG